MPNENPTPRSFFAECATILQTLSLYGAAGLAAFGWAMGWLLGVPTGEWLPLWFCAALLIYNADRLRRDPADALNVPARTAASARLRTASAVTLALAALVLMGLPVWRRDWVLLYVICCGAFISLGYSLPILGFRWKDLPLIKTLFAPAIVTLSIFGLPLLAIVPPLAPAFSFVPLYLDAKLGALAAWCFAYLLFNMLLCDLRDRTGDALCGIRSLPVVLGEKRTRRLLWALAVIGQLLLLALRRAALLAPLPLALLALLTGLAQAALLHATRRPRSERFYEWWVEGILFLPAIACAGALFFSKLAAAAAR